MNAVKEWFYGLAPRERVMVSAAAVMVLIAIFYYGLWHPLNTALANAREQVTAESNQARWMLGIRNEAQLLRSSTHHSEPKGQNESLLSIVDSTSRANNLGGAVTHIQPKNDDEATVTLDKANFNRMLFWLRTLQTDYGVVASEATISRAQDAPGQVEARLTLVRGGQ
ncbi:type II secretion system protein GspM [Salinisphaera hydrothermalis]|uniref:Type II secretion system protein M n=1 Tax=Salinisphaera hydrothermalis (strain C41B8) TaxID=1304275 RepID=A0A084IQP9_SALHC|nr:type II secretion system protein M [Salinisphaera hydrothermalis]KEZ79033.1 general secretion pathway protein M [Salinisphaera hydrothermalis C41B8]